MDSEVRTTTADALLGLLSLRPMSGYDLKQMIDVSIGNFWSESYGQIYPALKKLESEGWVRGTEEGKAGRRVYTLSAAGRERLETWLEVPPRPRVPRQELLLKVFFAQNVPLETTRSHIEEMRARFAADLLRYEATLKQTKLDHAGNPGLPYWTMTLNFGRSEAKMIVTWCDECLASLTGLALLVDPAGTVVTGASTAGSPVLPKDVLQTK